MSKLVEMIAQFLTELTGSPVDKLAATGVLVIGVVSILIGLFAIAWRKSEQSQWDELKRLEEEED